MTTEKQGPAAYAHLLRADPRLIAKMQQIFAEADRRDREAAAQRETARVVREANKAAARIIAANEKRLGLAPPPAPTTKLGARIVRADARRRGE
ncbi:hypothetical protein F6X40_28700 [Paraburkholderia sp. UCT31]|uniref:hypothetical protein n=1 Tax=Paraburkholderia sp. UCT31 TaxID=2615209 RepID=UPI00165631E8|nr:hypothetical protein [Paraburkholderia sp. UCT31]MBC8740614.1 hypothetical protein [Paraburkholderia sp. UCT31]